MCMRERVFVSLFKLINVKEIILFMMENKLKIMFLYLIKMQFFYKFIYVIEEVIVQKYMYIYIFVYF